MNHPATDQFASHYLALFKNSSDAILLLREGRLWANPAAVSLFGLPDKAGADAVFDPQLAPAADFFARLAKHGSASADFALRRAGGRSVMMNLDGSTLTSPAGATYQAILLRVAGVESRRAVDLQHEEVGLRAVITALPDMFWLKNTNGAYVMCNAAFEQYAGAPEAELVGKTDFDFADHVTAEQCRLHDAAAVLADGPVTEEGWIRFRHGGRRALMAATKAAIRDAEGHVLGILGMARDMTVERRQGRLLEANNAALSMIARGAPLKQILQHVIRNIEGESADMLCSVMLLDADGKHLHVGAAPSLPEAFCSAIDPLQIGPCVGSCGTAAFTGKPVFSADIQSDPLWENYRELAQEHGLRAGWSTPIASSAGSVLGTFAIYYREPRSPDQEDLALIAMATSITSIAIESSRLDAERKRVADELRDHQARLALALEGSETGVWDRDLRERKVNYSTGWKRLFGFREEDQPSSAEDSVGRLHPDDLPHVKANFQAHLQGKSEIYAAEHRVRCKNGSYKWVVSRGKIVDRTEEGTPLRMIGTTTDISDMKALSEKLRQGRDLITNLTNEVPGLVYQYQLLPDGRSFFPYASEGIRKIYEVAPEHVARDESAVHRLIHPDDHDAYLASLLESAERLTPWSLEYRVVLPVQGMGWRHGQAQPRQLPDGSILWHGFITDISERKRLEKVILENEEKYRTVTENSPDAIMRYDRELRRIYINKAYEKISGRSVEYMMGKLPTDSTVLDKPMADVLMAKLKSVLETGVETELEVSYERAGKQHIYHTRLIPEFDSQGKVNSILSFSREITERKRMEAELQQLATTDFLTGLPNRRYFVDKMEEELARIRRLGVPRTSVLMIDIDHFKNINDTHGHGTGDLVLKHFAEVARSSLRRIDTVGRVGGEEFAIILPGADVREAEIFAERFRKKVEGGTVEHDGSVIRFTISIGISSINPKDAGADDILSRTDKALYKAKTSGRNRVEMAAE